MHTRSTVTLLYKGIFCLFGFSFYRLTYDAMWLCFLFTRIMCLGSLQLHLFVISPNKYNNKMCELACMCSYLYNEVLGDELPGSLQFILFVHLFFQIQNDKLKGLYYMPWVLCSALSEGESLDPKKKKLMGTFVHGQTNLKVSRSVVLLLKSQCCSSMCLFSARGRTPPYAFASKTLMFIRKTCVCKYTYMQVCWSTMRIKISSLKDQNHMMVLFWMWQFFGSAKG